MMRVHSKKDSLKAAFVVLFASTLLAPAPAIPAGAASKPVSKPVSKPAEIDAAVTEAVAFVEKARQVQFVNRPKVIVLNDKAFKAALKKEQDADPASVEQAKELDATLLSLGLIRRPATGQKLLNAVTASGVLGYYSPKTKTMTIRGTKKITPLLRTILVHELTHALDDQRHNLDRPEFDNVTDGTDEAYVYTVEGAARWVENLYRASLSKSQKSLLTVEETKLSFDPALTKVLFDANYSRATLFLIPQLLNPYELGKVMVADLVEAEGTAGLEKAFTKFPTTTEQASSYAKFKTREPAKVVPIPKFDGTKITEGVLGIGGLNALLTTPKNFGGDGLSSATKGWGGDHFVVFKGKDKRICFRIDVVMDTPEDLSELKDALAEFGSELNGNVSEPQSGLVRFDSCDR
jgi:hypothetical protein